MGYTVKDFIDSNNFPEMKLISDNSEINREIKGARTIAVPDMEKFLGRGELLLTSLMVYEKLDKRMTVSYTHLTLPTIIDWCRSRWSPYH